MERNLKVVLTAEGNEFGANCVKALASYGCEVKLVKKDGKKLLEAIAAVKQAIFNLFILITFKKLVAKVSELFGFSFS